MPPRQYCGGGATGMELRMPGGYIGRAATGFSAATTMPQQQ
jgi:lactoylglutathione lyase